MLLFVALCVGFRNLKSISDYSLIQTIFVTELEMFTNILNDTVFVRTNYIDILLVSGIELEILN